MEQKCDDCKHGLKPDDYEPCKTCEWDELTGVFSNFTPKKDLNQLLREKLGYVEPPKPDAVKQPSHYMLKPGLEVRDVLALLVEKIKIEDDKDDWTQPYAHPLFISDYVQMMQYLMRFMNKNGKQDLEKARWYLDKLIEAYE